MVEEAGSFYPPDIIKAYEKGETIPSLVGDVHYRKEDHQCVRPVIIVKGKMQKDMKNKEDYYDVVEIVPGEGADAEAGRLRLQARRLHLSQRLHPWRRGLSTSPAAHVLLQPARIRRQADDCSS